MKLNNCTIRAHATCHGWQLRFGPQAPPEVLICSCECGHNGARYLVERDVLRPPPGWSAERFVAALQPAADTPGDEG